MSLATANVTTIASNVYVSTGNTVVPLSYFCNYTSSPVVVNVWAIPTGGTLSNLNLIYSNVTIAARDTLVIETEKFVLAGNDSIRANASANNAIAYTVSYTSI
jgi:hypothetical protein